MKVNYDPIGNVVAKQDEEYLETLYSYNLVNQLEKISYADGKTVEFEYNALRQLTQMQDWLGTTKIELDTLGHVTNVTDHNGNQVSYSYNALGQREKLTYPDGKEVNYAYNASGRLETVTALTASTDIVASANVPEITRYIYDPAGRLSQRILPEGTKTEYHFNQLGALTNLTHSKDNNILDQFSYSHDPVGNILQIDKHRFGIETDNGLFKYAYDPLNRLVEATNGAGNTKQYSYDPLGNRIASSQTIQGMPGEPSANGHPTETRHTFNARNQLIKTFEGDNVTDYQYDKRGNLMQIVENGQLKTSYTFDATNMMTAAHNSDIGDATYTYNGFLKRVAKLENHHSHSPQVAADINIPDPSKNVQYVLDMTLPYDNLLMTQGTQNQSFTWGNSLLSANGACNFHYLQDHLGSPIRLLGEDSQSTTMSFDEFGVPEAIATSGTFANALDQSSLQEFNDFHRFNPFGFTGYQSDEISGMYYAQARFYNPVIGRFGAEDPIRHQLNWYGYCGANPISFIDPSGLLFGCICGKPGCGGDCFSQSITTTPSPTPTTPDPNTLIGPQQDTGIGNTTGPFADNIATPALTLSPGAADSAYSYHFYAALAYIKNGSPTGQALYNVLSKASISFNVEFSDFRQNDFMFQFGQGFNFYSPDTFTINWNPVAGLVLSDGTVMSPAMVLFHEMGHAAQHIQGYFDAWLVERECPTQILLMENNNLRTWERPIARELDEPMRLNYLDTIGWIQVCCATSWGERIRNEREGIIWPWESRYYYVFVRSNQSKCDH